MWKKLESTQYIISCTSNNDEIYVTDYLTIWFGKFSAKELLECAKSSNASLKINDSELFSKITDMLDNIELLKNVNTVLEEGSSSPNLSLHLLRSYGYPVRLNLVLAQGDKLLFFEKVTKCLLETVRDLKASEVELTHMLTKKDNEIKEYKEEGGKIALRHLKTPKFNEIVHAEAHNCMRKHFGDTGPLVNTEEILLRNKEVLIKEEPVAVKEETPVAVKEETPSEGEISVTDGEEIRSACRNNESEDYIPVTDREVMPRACRNYERNNYTNRTDFNQNPWWTPELWKLHTEKCIKRRECRKIKKMNGGLRTELLQHKEREFHEVSARFKRARIAAKLLFSESASAAESTCVPVDSAAPAPDRNNYTNHTNSNQNPWWSPELGKLHKEKCIKRREYQTIKKMNGGLRTELLEHREREFHEVSARCKRARIAAKLLLAESASAAESTCVPVDSTAPAPDRNNYTNRTNSNENSWWSPELGKLRKENGIKRREYQKIKKMNRGLRTELLEQKEREFHEVRARFKRARIAAKLLLAESSSAAESTGVPVDSAAPAPDSEDYIPVTRTELMPRACRNNKRNNFAHASKFKKKDWWSPELEKLTKERCKKKKAYQIVSKMKDGWKNGLLGQKKKEFHQARSRLKKARIAAKLLLAERVSAAESTCVPVDSAAPAPDSERFEATASTAVDVKLEPAALLPPVAEPLPAGSPRKKRSRLCDL